MFSLPSKSIINDSAWSCEMEDLNLEFEMGICLIHMQLLLKKGVK